MPAPTTCPICETQPLASKEERSMFACFGCARTLGLAPMPPPRRPPLPCARCKGISFIRSIPREHSVDNVGDQVAAPFYVTHVPVVEKVKTGRKTHPIAIEHGRGQLETYVCRGCGFIEWYCTDPDDIPIGPHCMTDEITYATDAPYR
jgi:hypothetical protein